MLYIFDIFLFIVFLLSVLKPEPAEANINNHVKKGKKT